MAQNKVTPRKKPRSKNEKKSPFFENVKKRRLELGLTQAAFAQLLDVSQSRISSLENGAFVESAERVDQIARALETTPDYLFGFKDDP